MVITEAAAARIFGEKDPMGEIVSIKPYGDVMITGVAKDKPKNTHLKAEAFVSFATLIDHHGASFTNDEKNRSNFHKFSSCMRHTIEHSVPGRFSKLV